MAKENPKPQRPPATPPPNRETPFKAQPGRGPERGYPPPPPPKPNPGPNKPPKPQKG
jgi:hypothetical protein